MQMTDEMREMFNQYLKETLSLSVRTEKSYGAYGQSDDVRVEVTLYLGEDIIASDSDYTSL